MEKNLTLTTESTYDPVPLVPIIDGESGATRVTVAKAYKDLRNSRTTTESAKTFNVLFKVLCTSTVITFLFGFLNLLPLFILVVGAMNYDDCPVERRIPVYMVVDGVGFLVRSAIFFCLKHDPTVAGNQYWKMTPKLLVNAFLFAWLICGSIWIFSTEPDFEDPLGPRYCNKLAYMSAYVYAILQWIAFPLGLMIGCCMLVVSVLSNRSPAVPDELTCV